MKPQLYGINVRARCPACGGTVTTFEATTGGSGHGAIVVEDLHEHGDRQYRRIVYQLLRCAGCGRGGLAEIHCDNEVIKGTLGSFFPRSIEQAPLPEAVPDGIESEYREAEICVSVEAWRAASAMLRSTLEKALKNCGYEKGVLATRIDEAAADGVITAVRSKRAHEDVRVLGNDVLHEPWREVTQEEVEEAHHYVQRSLPVPRDVNPRQEVQIRASHDTKLISFVVGPNG